MAMTAFVLLPSVAAGQDDAAKQPGAPAQKGYRPAASDESLESIIDAYNQELLQVERRRLERMGRLAARQNPTAAAATYEQLFRLAIAGSLFRDAEPIAEAVVNKGSASTTTVALAYLVKVLAESDRGAYQQSLESLRRVVEETDKAARGAAPKAVLQTGEAVEICDAYYQQLIHRDQLETAKQAFRMLRERVRSPALVEFLSGRLKRLEMVGKPAPPIQGTDLDGKPFNLADAKGKVVLVVFWASWCLPSAAEVEAIQQVADSYRARGFGVVGINLDTLQDGGTKLETVMPNIRRFLLDHNVRWPTLINGSGEKDYAAACGVTEIPANVLIGRDGVVAQIDLVQKNLEPVIARVVGR
jgi:thiol-disulfide isomerase/thioredoxin